jgi:hypothetical protein
MAFQTGVDVHSGAGTNSNILQDLIVQSTGSQGNLKVGCKSTTADTEEVTFSITCGNTVVAESSVPLSIDGNYPQYMVNMRVPANQNIIFNTTATAAAKIYWCVETS